MKKNLLTLAVCAAIAMSANAVETGDANIYASGLKVTQDGVQFVLNATPTEVLVKFYNGETCVKTIKVDNAVKGLNKVDLEGVFEESVANTSLTWEVVAKAESNSAIKIFSDESSASQMLAYPSHIVVDNNPNSLFFGRIYVNEANSYTYADKGRTTSEGIYIFDANMEDVTNQGQNAWNGGVSWVNNGWKYSSPCMLYVADNGEVFISDWTDTHSGVWVMNPAKPEENFKPVFGGTRNSVGLVSQNGADIHGSISGICVMCDGEERVLYTYDEDLNGGGKIYSYNIGNMTQPWTATPTSVFYGNSEGKMHAGLSVVMRSDKRGGFWVSQHRYSDDDYPMLAHINSNGVMDWNSNKTFVDVNDNYGMDVSPDGSMVALACSGTIKVWNIEYDGNGVPSLNVACTIADKVSAKSFGVAFDVADNLYLADNSDHIRAFALPKANNSYTTVANAPVLVSDSMTGVADVAVDANAPVDYYNLQGVKVANPENGIFIKKQGAKATKVVL